MLGQNAIDGGLDIVNGSSLDELSGFLDVVDDVDRPVAFRAVGKESEYVSLEPFGIVELDVGIEGGVVDRGFDLAEVLHFGFVEFVGGFDDGFVGVEDVEL